MPWYFTLVLLINVSRITKTLLEIVPERDVIHLFAKMSDQLELSRKNIVLLIGLHPMEKVRQSLHFQRLVKKIIFPVIIGSIDSPPPAPPPIRL